MDDSTRAALRRRLTQLERLRLMLKQAQDFEQPERAARIRAGILETQALIDELRPRGHREGGDARAAEGR